jgi:hypothetical protein
MEHDMNFSKAKEAVANATFDLEIKKNEYAQVRNSQKKAKGNKGESAPTASESLVAAKSAYQKVTQAVDVAKLSLQQKEQRALNSMEIYYLMRPSSLGKILFRP